MFGPTFPRSRIEIKSLTEVVQAKTTITGLVPGSTVQFKYRAVTKTGEGDWSQPASLILH